MKNLLLTILIVISYVFGYAQLPGTNVQINVPVPDFNNCLLKENNPQKAFVYLPPSYYTDTLKRYPVVYYLPGFGVTGSYFKGYMDLLIGTGKTKEMIVVSPYNDSKLVGAFYTNSPLTGNWDNFISIDLVNYMDSNFRTIAKSDARAIGGHSMGGFGALNLSMLHPDVFCIGYGISPGLFNENGLNNCQILTIAARNNYYDFVNSIQGLSKAEAHAKYLTAISSTLRTTEDKIFSFAYGSAFSADTSLFPPYINFPYSKNGTQWVVDSSYLKNYENGFGNLKAKATTYKSNLQKLKGYVIDFGTNDEYAWIPGGCRYYDKVLTDAGINHEFYSYSATHSSALDTRIKDFMLPMCSSRLEFDTVHFSSMCSFIGIKVSNQIGSPIIDTINKTALVTVRATIDLKTIKPTIYISPGAQISPASNVITDFSNGSLTYVITSEDGSKSETWVVSVVHEPTAINKLSSTVAWSVYPNPATNQLTIIGDDDTYLIQISAADGKIVYQNTCMANVPFDIAHLAKGTYILQASGNKSYTPVKFIKE